MKVHLFELPANADPEKWSKAICIECGRGFYVRKCYQKRGQGKFCSTSCGVRYRNLHNNPSKRPEVREKISLNHADVSGANNPMFGKRGKQSPGYIDGRNSISGDKWRKIALLHKPPRCELCGSNILGRELHVHYKDKNRKNNSLENLQVVCVRCHNLILHKHSRDNLGRFVS